MKTPSKLFYTVIAFVLIGTLTVGAVYVVSGTSIAYFLLNRHSLLNGHDDCDHNHDHVHGDIIEIALSPTASRNIGLDDSTIATVEVTEFYKSFSFPGVVVERPGFSTLTVPSPVSGVITRIYHEAGVAVEPGEPLFDLLLNQQESISTQMEFLTLMRRRAFNADELRRARLDEYSFNPRQRRELEHEENQINFEVNIQANLLLLQGLSETDITESLIKDGTIVRTITVYAPPFVSIENVASAAHAHEEHIFAIDEMFVSVGQNITVGDPLLRLTDYCKLAIKGKVFSANEKTLTQALLRRSRVSATFEGNGKRETVDGLFLRSIDNRIDTASGTLFCYVDLNNRFTVHMVDSERNPRRYIKWHFKPGQRCELHVEIEPIPNCIVLPIGAIARDFQEIYVFEWVGNEGDRRIWRKRPVHVIHQTRDVVVIANDGSIFPEARVATRGANFILAAIEAANLRALGIVDDGGCNDGCGGH